MDDSFTLYDLKVEVTGAHETFVCSHALGHAFDVIGENLVFSDTKQFSLYSLAALLPLLPAKQRRTHENDWMTTDALIACPDPHCGAQFKITRTTESSYRHSETTDVPLRQDEKDALHGA